MFMCNYSGQQCYVKDVSSIFYFKIEIECLHPLEGAEQNIYKRFISFLVLNPGSRSNAVSKTVGLILKKLCIASMKRGNGIYFYFTAVDHN